MQSKKRCRFASESQRRNNPFIAYQAAKLSADAEHIHATATLRKNHESTQSTLQKQLTQSRDQIWTTFSQATQAAENDYKQVNDAVAEELAVTMWLKNHLNNQSTTTKPSRSLPAMPANTSLDMLTSWRKSEAEWRGRNPDVVLPLEAEDTLTGLLKERQRLKDELAKEKNPEFTPEQVISVPEMSKLLTNGLAFEFL